MFVIVAVSQERRITGTGMISWDGACADSLFSTVDSMSTTGWQAPRQILTRPVLS